ncbi:hypothetical protein IKQ19_14410 [Candidatus Saccharibacteria bacterium]|nr:hypothetical protein [Candidatus Saccharibacteria bacterium]
MDKAEWFPHAGIWLNVLFQLSIGFIINFVFYVTQVYIPQRKLTLQANSCIRARIQEIVRRMSEIFLELGRKYNGKYDENDTTSKILLEILRKINFNDRITVLNPSRLNLNNIDDNSYFTVKEWIITRLEFIEHDTDALFKYYTVYITPDLMKILEKIPKTFMHCNLARMAFKMPFNTTFEKCNEDILLTPYFALMKELQSVKDQYQ